MNSMLELTDDLGLDYYFVSLSTKDDSLFIRSLNNYCKPIYKAVKLAEIEGLMFEKEGDLDSVCFDYENEHYQFIDYGNHLMPFLKTIFLPLNIR